MPDGPRPGEVLTAKSDGRWLGDFAAVYPAPVDSSITGYAEPPVGWTWCSNFETSGCDFEENGCSCFDCCGEYLARLVSQRTVGETIDPCLTLPSGDGFGVAIAPQNCVHGCAKQRLPGTCNCIHPADSVICKGPTPAVGTQTRAGYPLTNFGVCNPSAGISVVADSSGPVGLEDLAAMQIDFSGVGAEGATFVGEGGGYDPLRPPFAYSSTPANVKHTDSAGTAYITTETLGTPGLNTGRSNTGISVFTGDCLQADFWVKAVPDRFGYTCVGYDFTAKIASATGQYLTPPGFHDTVILDGSWQHFVGDFSLNFATPEPLPFLEANIVLMTGRTNRLDARTGCGAGKSAVQPPRGRVLVKAVHVAACQPLQTTPIHVWRHH